MNLERRENAPIDMKLNVGTGRASGAALEICMANITNLGAGRL